MRLRKGIHMSLWAKIKKALSRTRYRIDSPPPLRIRLDQEQFADLVQGKAVTIYSDSGFEDAEIILADIGYINMRRAIQEAEEPRARPDTWESWCKEDEDGV